MIVQKLRFAYLQRRQSWHMLQEWPDFTPRAKARYIHTGRKRKEESQYQKAEGTV